MSSTFPVFWVGVTLAGVVGRDLVAEEVEVHPGVGAPALAAAEDLAVEPAGGVEVADEKGEVERLDIRPRPPPRGFHSAASRMDQRWMIQPSRNHQSTAASTNITAALISRPWISCPSPGMKKLASAAITLPVEP